MLIYSSFCLQKTVSSPAFLPEVCLCHEGGFMPLPMIECLSCPSPFVEVSQAEWGATCGGLGRVIHVLVAVLRTTSDWPPL